MTAPAYWSDDLDALMRRLGASASGLSGEEARQRLAAAGPSTPQQARAADAVRLIARQFASPLVLILVCGSLLAMALREWTEASVILAIVAGSTALGFAQEYRAGRAIDALQRRFALHARVLRDGAEIGVPFHEVVTSDIVILSAGDVVPADGRILEASDFLVSEASLTGESFPVEKRPGVAAADAPLSERSNCAFAGGSVRSGFAKMLVCATGEQSLLGAVAKNLQRGEQETEFSRGLRRFGYLLLRVAVLLVVFVLVVNQLLGRPFLESLLFSVALAVGLSPELLPAIVSVTLSAGARRMAKAGVLVRRLEAIENLGEIDVLCTDKTGTLTLGAARLDSALDPQGQPSTRAMDLAFINAGFESGIENPLDRAIIAAGEDQSRTLGDTIQGWRKIDEIPYDFQRKRLTIVVARDDQAEPLIICKGAFEQVLQICTEVETEGGPIPLTPALRTALTARYGAFGGQGQRVLGIAARACAAQADFTRDDERDMRFSGFLAFADPVKADAAQVVASLAASGLAVKVITGDNRFVAQHVADVLGLGADAVMTGAEIDALKGDALRPRLLATRVFAEVEPQHKERIVRVLQRAGKTVGFLGDGVNDAPALQAADVGISVDGAVDVARAAADVLLTQQDLGVLLDGVRDGRRAFANTLKYICITTGSSFGNMVSMAFATPLLPFLPLTAAQTLVINFMTDLPLMAVAADKVDPEQEGRPERWNIRNIQSFMLVFGLVSSVFDLITFWLLRGVLHAEEAVFQTSWFQISVLTEIVALVALRTARPFWTSRPAPWIMRLSIIVVLIALAAPYLPYVSQWFALRAPPADLLLFALFIAASYGVATEAAKRFYYRKRPTPPA